MILIIIGELVVHIYRLLHSIGDGNGYIANTVQLASVIVSLFNFNDLERIRISINFSGFLRR